jgi:hypothetical protein
VPAAVAEVVTRLAVQTPDSSATGMIVSALLLRLSALPGTVGAFAAMRLFSQLPCGPVSLAPSDT